MSQYLTPKKRKKKKIAKRRVFLLLLLIAAVLSICLFTPFFHIKTVEVVGNEVIASERILELSGIPTGQNIFRIHKRSIKKSIMSIPEIEKVKINRILPSKVRLSVTETPPVMYFPYLSGYAITNQNGRVLALSDSDEGLDLIKMTGLEIKNAEIYEKMSVQNTVSFDIMISTIQAFGKHGLLPEIRSCHFDNIADFYLYLKDGTKVIFGKTTDMEYKLSVLTAVLEQVNRTEGTYIDLTVPERTISGTLTPTPAPSATPAPEEGGEEESPEASQEPEESAEPESTEEETEETNEP